MMVQVSSMNAAHMRMADGASRAPGAEMKSAAGKRMLNAMTVDVEDYFQVRAFAGVLDRVLDQVLEELHEALAIHAQRRQALGKAASK